MALNKRTYTDGITVITAGNLNDIQDAIIALEGQDIPAPYNSNPEAPGEASPGTSDEFARGDHVHPLPPVDSALSDSSENPVQNKVIKAALDDKADIIVSSATGAVASFSDGADGLPVKDLTIGIEPVQNLNGYDNPWPAGGGKNLLTALPSPGTTAWFCEPDGFLFKANQTYCFSISDDVNVGSYSIYAADKTTQLAYASSYRKVVYTPSVDTVGYPRLYAGEGVSQEAINFAQLELGDSRTTFAPYSNICPISGWTGAEVTRTGKNLLDTKSGKSTTTSAGITAVKNADGSYNVTGTASGVVNLWLRGDWGSTTPIMKLYAGRTYYIKDVTPYNGTAGLSYSVNIGGSITFTPSKDVFVTGIRATTPNGTTLNTVVYPYIGLVPYEEWQPFGDTYSIAFPSEAGTVYGGTLDVTTGKLTVDRAMVDLGTLTWEALYTEANNKTVLSHFPVLYPHVQTHNIIAENYKYYGAVSATTNLQHPDSLAVGLRSYYQIDFPQYDDIIYAVLPISDSPAGKVVYPLATPTVYDLTPTEVTSLLGTNNIWADTGDSTVQYRADTKLYIAAIEDENRQLRLTIAPIEDGATASQAYSQGKYFFRNGSFCKAKTSIASGASFTLNTNYEVTTVAAELFTALNS